MAREAARDAADRVWTMRFPPRPWPLPDARRVATDVDWTRGEEIRGPIAALLLRLTGAPGGGPRVARPPGAAAATAPQGMTAPFGPGCEPPTRTATPGE